MQQETTEGIVLRALDYQENKKIITLFSRDAGLISLILKGLSRKNTRRLALTSAFCEGEFLYRKGRSDLFTFIDGTPLNENLHFRTNFTTLQAAGSLASAILRSQLLGKPAPLLYQLLRTYFKHLPTFTDPSPLVASFHLKLLKHEGLLSLEAVCSECASQPARALKEGESLCKEHQGHGAANFTESEWDLLLHLENAQHFQALRTVRLPPPFAERIAALFQDRLKT